MVSSMRSPQEALLVNAGAARFFQASAICCFSSSRCSQPCIPRAENSLQKAHGGRANVSLPLGASYGDRYCPWAEAIDHNTPPGQRGEDDVPYNTSPVARGFRITDIRDVKARMKAFDLTAHRVFRAIVVRSPVNEGRHVPGLLTDVPLTDSLSVTLFRG